MNEVVKYHNDLNKIRLPSFTELEQNLLFILLTKIKEKNEAFFEYREILSMLNLDYRITEKEGLKIFESLKNKFFKADFTIIQREKLIINNQEKDVIANRTFNLFREFVIYYDKDQADPSPDPYIETIYGIELVVNEKFKYILQQITSNFTRFELAEFIAISGKYTKTLYRLLKQYRNTGLLKMEWSEFARIMDIPENYRQIDIDNRILKPAIKELTQERTLLDQKRIPFKNLTYKKHKQGGNKIVGIEFSFDIQPQELESQEPNTDTETNKEPQRDISQIVNNLADSTNIKAKSEQLRQERINAFNEWNQIVRATEGMYIYFEGVEVKIIQAEAFVFDQSKQGADSLKIKIIIEYPDSKAKIPIYKDNLAIFQKWIQENAC